MKYKYIVIMLYPTIEKLDEGTIEESQFEQLFKKNYGITGERYSPPSTAIVDGVLIVSDGRTIVSLPIVHWATRDGKPLYLCQGTSDPGKAPAFSVDAQSREAIVKLIKETITKNKTAMDRAAELAPPPHPVIVGVHMTHIGGRRVPVGSILVTDRLKERDLKPHITQYQHADRSDELIAVKRVDREYLRTIGRFLDQLDRDTTKFTEKAVVRVVLIWSRGHQEHYLTTEEAKRVYKAAIAATKDKKLVELLQYHLKLFDW